MNIAIIFAGGVGIRFKSYDIPKQFVEICGKPIIIHTLELFEKHNDIDKIYISILPSHKSYMEKLIAEYGITKVSGIVNGGETGQDSIFNALNLAYKENPENSVVLIHDGVRPIVDYDVISENIKTAELYGNAVTCTSCTETILVSGDGISPSEIPYRRETFAAQAPQSFLLGDIYNAHLTIRKRPEKYTDMVDSCTIYKYLNKKTYMVKGNVDNIKVTNPRDIFILKALIECRAKHENGFAQPQIVCTQTGSANNHNNFSIPPITRNKNLCAKKTKLTLITR